MGKGVTMTVDTIVDLGQRAMMVTLMTAAPMLVSGLAIGLVISILQSVTQIQEMTLTFIPKIVVVLIAFIVFLPFMADTVLVFVADLFNNIDTIGRQ
jgi:flagellar biosynthesis protein FliQ